MLKDQHDKTIKQQMVYDTSLERKENEIAQLKIDIEQLKIDSIPSPLSTNDQSDQPSYSVLGFFENSLNRASLIPEQSVRDEVIEKIETILTVIEHENVEVVSGAATPSE